MTIFSAIPGYPGMPPEQGLPTPSQDLSRAPVRQPAATSYSVNLARCLAFGGALALGAFGTYEMMQVVSAGGTTVLEGIITALFAITFTWISFAASSAITGVLVRPDRRMPTDREAPKLSGRTALVMPVYNENPAEIAAALRVMGRGLAEAGRKRNFEIVIISDTSDPDAWVAETAAVDQLQRALAGLVPVWYRRRWDNAGKKAGNVREFIERWGGRYDHFIVLDADSLMAPSTLIELAAAMEEDPQLGILQTVPTLAGGRTLFQRMQQFANRIYGPVVANGLAAWQGGDGNYWGHNAIIRTSAFAQCCGLPDLPGRQPFGGQILSHDFVEAALMRRAGWKVEIATDLPGSWEDSPPSLVDTAVRDRRWAQGNLQHLRIIGAKGLAWPSRVHFAAGIMSYCASPIWLLLIVAGFALALQAHFVKPEYFPDGLQLFPTWPVLDSERMIRLFIVTMGVLLLPKFIGLTRALLSPHLRRDCGGGLRLVGSAVVELALSALYAPIMMVIHSRHVFEILVGRDAGWAPQRRGHGGMTWGDAVRCHYGHTLIGLGTAVVAWILSPGILAWLAPTLAGLVLSAPLSYASGSEAAGRALRRFRLLLTPEERSPSRILREHRAAIMDLRRPVEGIVALVRMASVREAHLRWAFEAPRRRGYPDSAQLTAAQKLSEAETLEEALSWLDKRERMHVISQPALIDRLIDLDVGTVRRREQAPQPQPNPISSAERQQDERALGGLVASPA
ncbi:glucans biosynthesis glucosyltransferase MdoH [Aquibium oceanicum]|nr:glucans biosynthesis glucosyltransferase MdoH [Aquibium oceanicum]